ncbi:hypothetical protein J2X06_002219 [Lysobacter niastensis]|uniref:Uncharacterized protein n=1 Tax=Lysobacter niastensis TaxID=380629 RepID=A0ABU1WCE7_9GAMM|nr:hypothetical protein [Lysobacter niastensis]
MRLWARPRADRGRILSIRTPRDDGRGARRDTDFAGTEHGHRDAGVAAMAWGRGRYFVEPIKPQRIWGPDRSHFRNAVGPGLSLDREQQAAQPADLTGQCGAVRALVSVSKGPCRPDRSDWSMSLTCGIVILCIASALVGIACSSDESHKAFKVPSAPIWSSSSRPISHAFSQRAVSCDEYARVTDTQAPGERCRKKTVGRRWIGAYVPAARHKLTLLGEFLFAPAPVASRRGSWAVRTTTQRYCRTHFMTAIQFSLICGRD